MPAGALLPLARISGTPAVCRKQVAQARIHCNMGIRTYAQCTSHSLTIKEPPQPSKNTLQQLLLLEMGAAVSTCLSKAGLSLLTGTAARTVVCFTISNSEAKG